MGIIQDAIENNKKEEIQVETLPKQESKKEEYKLFKDVLKKDNEQEEKKVEYPKPELLFKDKEIIPKEVISNLKNKKRKSNTMATLYNDTISMLNMKPVDTDKYKPSKEVQDKIKLKAELKRKIRALKKDKTTSKENIAQLELQYKAL